MKPTQSESVRPDPKNPNAVTPTSAARPDILRPEPNGARISRRTALRQLAVGGTGLALGLQRAYAPPPVQNNLLGSVVELNQGNWFTVCTDYSGANCTNTIWMDVNGISPTLGFLNNNYAGNTNAFSSSGGYSDMFVLDLPFVPRKIYRITWVGQLANSLSDLDEMQFIINQQTIVDKMYRTSGPSGKSERSVLYVNNGNPVNFTWRAKKVSGTNSGFRFRVDNVRIEQLPEPVLAVFQYDATHIVVWWDKIYGRDSIGGTYLMESPSLQNPDWQTNLSPPWDVTDDIGATIGYGKIIDRTYANTKYFKLNVTGTPAAP